jgi:hypothetical protein
MFIYAIRSPYTKESYFRRLRRFFDAIELCKGMRMEERCNTFAYKARTDYNWAFNNILWFLQSQKERVERKEITGGTLRNYVKTIKMFCEVTDIIIPWKKITRGLPRGKRYADDRAPTIEEICKIIEYPDRRIKPIVYTMTSSGIRVGAWDHLKWDHIRPLIKNGKLIAAKVVVYADEDDQYFTFITAEAYTALELWMKYRSNAGEQITNDSWVMRDLWNVAKPPKKEAGGQIQEPIKLQSIGVKRLVERALWAQGIRTQLEYGKSSVFSFFWSLSSFFTCFSFCSSFFFSSSSIFSLKLSKLGAFTNIGNTMSFFSSSFNFLYASCIAEKIALVFPTPLFPLNNRAPSFLLYRKSTRYACSLFRMTW